MKNLKITITLGMQVPDHWEVVENASGVDVIDIGDGRCLDFTFTPTLTSDGFKHNVQANTNTPDSNTSDSKLASAVVGMVTEYDAVMKMLTEH